MGKTFIVGKTLIAAVLVGAGLLYIALSTEFDQVAHTSEPTVAGIGERVMSTYILPFEVVSVVLLVALVGATYIARRGPDEDGKEQ